MSIYNEVINAGYSIQQETEDQIKYQKYMDGLTITVIYYPRKFENDIEVAYAFTSTNSLHVTGVIDELHASDFPAVERYIKEIHGIAMRRL